MAFCFCFSPLLLYASSQAGFREAVNVSLELGTVALGGISVLFCDQLRHEFNAFVGAGDYQGNKSLGVKGLRQGLTM